jgi:uncharacterized protein YwgA
MPQTEQLIDYIIQHLSGKITKTQLVKLMYLTDLESVRFTGSQASDIRWKFHHYGPYDENLDNRLKHLEKGGTITVQQKNKKDHPDDIYFLYRHTGKEISYEFEPTKKQIVDTILDQYGSFTLDALLKYVYDTEPVRKTKRGEYLDLKKFLNDEKVVAPSDPQGK